MNVSYYIGKRIRFAQKGSFSRISSNLAVISISLGIVVLLVSMAVLGGFKKVIVDKVYNFDADITLTKVENFKHSDPISLDEEQIKEVQALPSVKTTYNFANILGILQFNNEIEGVGLFGIDSTFDAKRFTSNYFEGDFLSFDDKSEILVSKYLANRLDIKVGDKVLFNILGNKGVRHRYLKVKGIYRTDIEEVDKKKVIGDINMVRRLYGWDSDKVEGVKIDLNEGYDLVETEDDINEMVDYDMVTINIENEYFALFDWLKIISGNVNFLIIIVFSIVFLNITSIVLILIMERSNMIGILKAMGATNRLVRDVFVVVVERIMVISLLIGNGIAITFCVIQHYFKLIPLNAENYYMDCVPIMWDWYSFIGVNLSMISLISIIVFIPTIIISSISPIKAIKFE